MQSMAKTKYSVEFSPWSLAPWFSQVFSGLYDLQAKGVVQTRLTEDLGAPVLLDRFSMLLRVRNHELDQSRIIGIDLNDTSKFSAKDGLNAAEIVFKRSYRKSLLDTHSADIADRTVPYGINYNCYSSSIHTLRIIARHYRLRIRAGKQTKKPSGPAWRRHHARFLLSGIPNNTSISEKAFRWRPDEPSKPQVFFITRLQASQSRNETIEHLTQQRIELVRRLRAELGDGFLGGIVKDTWSTKLCPKELLIDKLSRREFIAALRSSDVLVSTLGVGRSTPWKFAEGLATSRCILTEPLYFDVPHDLEEGRDIHVFRNSDECVEKAVGLLEDQDLVAASKKAAWNLYEHYVKADSLLKSVLERAFE